MSFYWRITHPHIFTINRLKFHISSTWSAHDEHHLFKPQKFSLVCSWSLKWEYAQYGKIEKAARGSQKRRLLLLISVVSTSNRRHSLRLVHLSPQLDLISVSSALMALTLKIWKCVFLQMGAIIRTGMLGNIWRLLNIQLYFVNYSKFDCTITGFLILNKQTWFIDVGDGH